MTNQPEFRAAGLTLAFVFLFPVACITLFPFLSALILWVSFLMTGYVMNFFYTYLVIAVLFLILFARLMHERLDK